MIALLAILFATALGAQSPPLLPMPAPGTACVAWPGGWQPGDLHTSCDLPLCVPPARYDFDAGECYLAGYCDASDATTLFPPRSIWIWWGLRAGGTVYLQTASMQPGTTTAYPIGVVWHFFLLAEYIDEVPTALLPFCDPQWGNAYGGSTQILIPAGQFAHSQLAGSQVVDFEIAPVQVPADSALIGYMLQVQAGRLDTTNGLIYLSSPSVIEIGHP